jgi:hypothetical protein
MSVLVHESTAERRAIKAIRAELRLTVESGQMSVEEVAGRLGLASEGVRSLLLREWSFEMAFRVATALGFDFAAAISEDA